MACPMQYDLYAPAATVANAVIKTVQLDPNDWSVPRAAVEAAFSDKTKLILINSPHKCAAAHGPACMHGACCSARARADIHT